jgi:FtsZ-binding cell division protein ZapB
MKMAVPSVITKQRDKMKAQADAAQATIVAAAATPAAPIVDTEPIKEIVNISPSDEKALENYTQQLDVLNGKLQNATAPETIAEVQQEIAALKQKYSSMLGRVQAEAKRADLAEARLHFQDDAVRTLEARVSEAERQRDEFRELEAKRVQKERLAGLDDTTDELSEDEVQTFDPKDIRMIRGITKKQFVPIVKSLLSEVEALKEQVKQLFPVGQQVTDIAKSHQALAVEAARAAEQTYYNRELTPHVPKWESTVKTPEWKAFLDSPSGNKLGVLKGHMLAHYRKEKYLPGIVALFNEFQMRNDSKGSGLQGLVVPPKSAAERQPAAKVVFKSSDYAKKQAEYLRGKTLSATDWEAYKTAFHKAKAEGRVEDDAGIFNR